MDPNFWRHGSSVTAMWQICDVCLPQILKLSTFREIIFSCRGYYIDMAFMRHYYLYISSGACMQALSVKLLPILATI